jgi:hypothetical protein
LGRAYHRISLKICVLNKFGRIGIIALYWLISAKIRYLPVLQIFELSVGQLLFGRTPFHRKPFDQNIFGPNAKPKDNFTKKMSFDRKFFDQKAKKFEKWPFDRKCNFDNDRKLSQKTSHLTRHVFLVQMTFCRRHFGANTFISTKRSFK